MLCFCQTVLNYHFAIIRNVLYIIYVIYNPFSIFVFKLLTTHTTIICKGLTDLPSYMTKKLQRRITKIYIQGRQGCYFLLLQPTIFNDRRVKKIFFDSVICLMHLNSCVKCSKVLKIKGSDEQLSKEKSA